MAISAKRNDQDDGPLPVPKKTTKVQKKYRANTTVKRSNAPGTKSTNTVATNPAAPPKDMQPQLSRIAASPKLTPYQKRVLTLLCQVPSGHVTTYALMASHLGSSPRAVGNAMRRNPFAPEVPCHRCVATGGGLGGFKGQWPRDGEGITLDEKRMLLRREGVRLDDAGRVLGTPFGGFV
ncbi:RING-2 like protein [Diaporthe sp. PMI_573]|jgi:methylated-DNA-[protein]-cysteine S-methyltransferase|nr:RING-2 like protein [Diaporthaceae sp. PMI_573]